MNTIDLLPTFISLGIMGGLFWFGIRNLQKDQSRQEARYWRQECMELEYENQFLRELGERLVPRLVSRLGAPFQDYLIERELMGYLPEVGTDELDKPRAPMQIFIGGTGKGCDITASRFVSDAADAENADDGETDEADVWNNGDPVWQNEHREAREQPAIRPYARAQRHRRALRPFPSPPPTFASNTRLRPPLRSNRAMPRTLPWQPENDDVIDAEYTEIPPGDPSGRQRQPESAMQTIRQIKPPAPRKGGRPKKYASAAERQAAYRARMAT